MMLLAKIKNTKAYATLGALLIVIAVCLSLLQALPAKAAASFCCSGSFAVSPSDPSAATLTVTSYSTEVLTVEVVVTTPSSDGSSQLVFHDPTQPATDPTPDTPGDAVVPWVGVVGTYGVFPGATITASIGGLQIASYTNPAITPDPVLAVPPSAPTFVDKPGTAEDGVTLPTAGCWIYKVNGAVKNAGEFVSVTGPVTVTAELATGCAVRPNTDTAYQWSKVLSGDVPPPADDRKQAAPPQAPDVNDADGAANDTITVYGAEGWSNPKLNGVSVVPGTYQVSPYVDGRGNLTVTYDLSTETHKTQDGSTSSSFGPFRFNDGTFVPPPHGEPNPVPAPAPAPAPAPQAAPAPVLASGGNPAPQVQASVQSATPAAQSNEVVSLTADTAAGTSGPDYTPSFLLGGAGLILLALALRRREQYAAK